MQRYGNLKAEAGVILTDQCRLGGLEFVVEGIRFWRNILVYIMNTLLCSCVLHRSRNRLRNAV